MNPLYPALERLPFSIDYVFLGDPKTLKQKQDIVGETLLALAVWVGKTRLIDNTLLNSNEQIKLQNINIR